MLRGVCSVTKRKPRGTNSQNIFITNLEASNAMVSLELLAVLVPFQRGNWVATGLAPKLHSLTGWDSVKLFLHFFWMSPLWGHC